MIYSLNMMKFTAKSINELLKDLKTTATGLSTGEAQQRLKKYGLNALPHKQSWSIFSIFFSQFKSPLIYVLLVAAMVSLFIGDVNDAEVIMAVVLINVAVGYWQGAEAQKK